MFVPKRKTTFLRGATAFKGTEAGCSKGQGDSIDLEPGPQFLSPMRPKRVMGSNHTTTKHSPKLIADPLAMRLQTSMTLLSTFSLNKKTQSR